MKPYTKVAAMTEHLTPLEERFILAKQGDKTAFEALYQELITPVFRFILVRTHNKELAEDLTQQVFLKALEALPKSKAPTKSPLAYFLTAARHTVIDYWRKKKDTLVAAPEETFEHLVSPHPRPDAALIAEESWAEIALAMQDLSDEQHEVLTLLFINEQTTEDVAAITNKSTDAIRQIKSRALKQLRKKMIAPT